MEVCLGGRKVVVVGECEVEGAVKRQDIVLWGVVGVVVDCVSASPPSESELDHVVKGCGEDLEEVWLGVCCVELSSVAVEV